MPLLPTFNENSTSRVVTDTFAGYNHNLKIADGEFYDTGNLSSKYYPLLSTREKRGLVREFSVYQGITALDGKLAFIDNQRLYYNGTDTGLEGITAGHKQMICTGSYICIFPDGLYYNIVDPEDHGSMGAKLSLDNQILTYQMCNLEGVVYERAEEGLTAPENPADNTLWIDTKNSKLKVWTVTTTTWTEIPTVYTRITFPAQTAGRRPSDLFRQYDGVTISGLFYDDLNGSKILYQVGNNYIVVIGVLKNEVTKKAKRITIERKVPAMDHVVECQNRFWGCFYGKDDKGGTLNEIYCCALGDFKNWNQFRGISTDSYVASVGTDGPWTAAINYLGYPTFFKENHIHRVEVSATGAHAIAETPCRGVPAGSGRSLAIINESLYYKSYENVCVYQGGFPSSISDRLGDVKYHDAVGGSIGDRYYLSMKDPDNKDHLFVADVSKGLWFREDELSVDDFVCVGNELYAVSGQELLALKGSSGTLEDDLEWYAQTGMIGFEQPDKKYISRFNLRMTMPKGAWMQILIEYDSDGVWREQGKRIIFNGTGTVNVPVRPRRCDHMRIRLQGKGPVKIYSLARILEVGSDY